VALDFCRIVRGQPNAVPVAPGPRHWTVFDGLCREARVKGNLVADAYLAALAIESGCEWVTTDGGFARFPGLKWRRP
jgi:predicted nucleic acid-binding protein